MKKLSRREMFTGAWIKRKKKKKAPRVLLRAGTVQFRPSNSRFLLLGEISSAIELRLPLRALALGAQAGPYSRTSGERLRERDLGQYTIAQLGEMLVPVVRDERQHRPVQRRPIFIDE